MLIATPFLIKSKCKIYNKNIIFNIKFTKRLKTIEYFVL